MASSQTVNVLRYAALGTGLVYGYVHHNSLSTNAELKRVEAAYKTKEELITKAKAAFAQSKLPSSSKSGDGKIIPDWEGGSNLDDYFKQLEADS